MSTRQARNADDIRNLAQIIELCHAVNPIGEKPLSEAQVQKKVAEAIIENKKPSKKAMEAAVVISNELRKQSQ